VQSRAHAIWKGRGKLSSAADIAAAELLHDETTERWQDWLAKAGVAFAGPLRARSSRTSIFSVGGHRRPWRVLCPVEVFRREIENGDLVVLSDVATLENESYFQITKSPRSKTVSVFSA
jgi:LysR family glycine cleavage system transcriptional activator